MRTCKTCGKSEPEVRFRERGLKCKDCLAVGDHLWYQRNKAHVAKRTKQYRQANPAIYRKAALKSYYKHRERCRERNRRWIKRNLSKLNDYRKRRYREPAEMLKVRLRSRIWCALLRRKSRKQNPTMELLGCDRETLFRHIESRFQKGMSWRNRGRWHVDHVRPLASFNLLDPVQLRRACHYKNLQPLWADDNHAKGAKYG